MGSQGIHSIADDLMRGQLWGLPGLRPPADSKSTKKKKGKKPFCISLTAKATTCLAERKLNLCRDSCRCFTKVDVMKTGC